MSEGWSRLKSHRSGRGIGVVLGALLVLTDSASVFASDEARDLLVRSESQHRSRSQEYAGELTVTSRDGKIRRKGWKSWRQGYAGDARLLIRFLDPPEVRGVGFLSLGRPGKNPDQWLYLPSMKRERRIASQDREASFVGTDFNYEDMEDFDQTKYDAKLLPDGAIDGQACWMIEVQPKEKSLYERKRLAMKKDFLDVVRVESFRKGEDTPVKRLTLSEIEEIEGHRVARKMEMTDLRKGSRTTVILKDLAFDRSQPGDRFTIQNLDREGGS